MVRGALFLVIVQIKRILQHRTDAIAWFVVAVLRLAVGLTVIFTVYSFIPSIEGFDAYACILVYAGYSFVTSLFYTLFPWTLWYSRRYIIEGRMLTMITKPIDPLLYLIGENFSCEEFLEAIANLLLFVIVAALSGVSWWRILALVALFVPSTMTVTGIFILVASLGARSHGIERAFSPITSMIDFAQYPTSIYPRGIRFFMNWIIPYSLIAFVPVSIALGVSPAELSKTLWWMPVYGISIFFISIYAFRSTLRGFESSGT